MISARGWGRGMVLAFALLLATASRALAFGEVGHQVIAALAQDMLTPKAKTQVRSILAAANGGGSNVDLAKVAVWADMIRGLRPETRAWHFVTLQIGDPGYNPAVTDTPNVVTALERQRALLCQPNADRYVREEALKWVIHLVGDLHQPLHVGEDHDKGGNLAMVKLNRRSYKLHAIWDDVLLQRLHLGPDSLHAMLARQIAADTSVLSLNAQGSVRAWVDETHAKSPNCYILHGKRMPKGIKVGLDKEYVHDATLIVLDQLKIASIRLAFVLNSALDPHGLKIMVPPVCTQLTDRSANPEAFFTHSDSVPVTVAEPSPVALPGHPPSYRSTSRKARFVWSANSQVYHFSNCADAIRIKRKNLRTGDMPPPGLSLHAACPVRR